MLPLNVAADGMFQADDLGLVDEVTEVRLSRSDRLLAAVGSWSSTLEARCGGLRVFDVDTGRDLVGPTPIPGSNARWLPDDTLLYLAPDDNGGVVLCPQGFAPRVAAVEWVAHFRLPSRSACARAAMDV
ncbi:MAG: hypothetical protein K0R99_4609 [Microbacterium sp.]|jgi:hypothetical protein|uniref:hypothetical protein n=1 Tax=Microbacterium sp. TaxID=51671 RepID=UPI002618A853|nr:hypothetical protein [Microbacterium sp.]MDF2563163.1 hypothetical protein [Microbacterium sp.]